jgi:hypothetical protein
MFSYDELHKVVVCHQCKSCIIPGPAGQTRHLRAEPHRLLGEALKATLRLLSSFDLKTIDELKREKPAGRSRCQPIEHLRVYDGFRCLSPECDYSTCRLQMMREHVAVHGVKAKEHKINPLWEACTLQTYFVGKGRIDYFIVGENGSRGDKLINSELTTPLRKIEEDLFASLEADYQGVKDDIAQEAGVVRDFGDSRSARVPWLERTGFPSHLSGLRDEEIRSSYQLPRRRAAAGGGGAEAADDDDDDADLARIADAAEAVLRDAYALCSDTSPDRKMTQQRANILSEFYAGASGRADGFRYYKNPSTLVKYFTTFKRLLAYYYHIVYRDDGHFTRAGPDQSLPGDAIQPTAQQRQAFREIIDALDGQQDDDDAPLKHAIRRLYLALICQTVGSVPFKSPVLSFCAMLSRRVSGKGRGLWEEPGNFNSHLSALTWTAQLLIFDYTCFHEQDNEDQIPVFLAKICKRFFHQLAETPSGHILQWRLYLFQVGRAAIAKHQARWSLDGQTVEYRGLELQMSHVSQLIVSEYQQAHALLHDELMFQARDLIPMQSWRLKDDLDMEDFGASWLSHPSNSEFVEGANLALLRRIQATAELRTMFLTEADAV